MRKKLIAIILFLAPLTLAAQEKDGKRALSLRQCLDYTLENNSKLQKDRLGIESAVQSRKEVIGSLLPQLNASGSMTYNIQKTTIAMPNFVNKMMPEPMQDPNAPKYMTVTMGMDLGANWGVSLTQQILNFSLFNAVEITKVAEEMSQTGVEADTQDVIARIATLYYNAQMLEYSMSLFDETLGVMERMSSIMEANMGNGLVRKVDADRVMVARTNMETEKSSLLQALEIQKNLLKLEMGFPMEEDITLEPVNISDLESKVFMESMRGFDVEEQLAFKMIKQQQSMLRLQRKSAISETLPSLMLNGNYSQNYMGDHFYGETYHHFPVSMVSLNLRVPLFTGMSKNAKIKKAGLELDKALRDEKMLVQSLTMGYNNARMQMDQNRNSLNTQKLNRELAQDVLHVTESNYNEGLATLSDLLNASSSGIQAQMNYVNAINNCIKAYIDLKKADGTINDIMK